MRNISALFIASAVAALASITACSPVGDGRPEVTVAEVPPPPFLDGLYSVKVTGFNDACEQPDPENVGLTRLTISSFADSVQLIDIRQHPFNAEYAIKTDSFIVPNVDAFTVSPQGAIEDVTVREGGTPGPTTLSGHVDGNGFDLLLTQTWSPQEGTACTRTAKLDGTRRPLTDAAADDGLYNLLIDVGAANACPISAQVTRTIIGRMDVAETSPLTTVFSLDYEEEPLMGSIDPALGTVSASQNAVEMIVHGQYANVIRQMTGTLNAPSGDLTVDTVLGKDAQENVCGQRVVLHAKKRLPDAAKPYNDYRMAYHWSEDAGCGLGDAPEPFVDVADITQNQFGLPVLRDFISDRGVVIALDQDNGFTYVFPKTDASKPDIWYEGSVQDGGLSYSFNRHYPATATEPECNQSLTADGVIRFVPLPAAE